MKCNLDCSYCRVDTYGGHDNAIPHPPVDQCLKTVDFMLEYADRQMTGRSRSLRYVILNVYGGESLHHPQIVEILQYVKNRYQQYQDRWNLVVTTTTNAIITDKKLQAIVPLIDEFTVSYHTENTTRQKELFKKNLLTLQQHNKRLKCVVLVHPEPDKFKDVESMIQWLTTHGIKHLPRQLDHSVQQIEFNYNPQQVTWFKKLYQDKSYRSTADFEPLLDHNQNANLAETGRACCGGRQLCADQNYRTREFFVENRFPDWYCSVDRFFLFVKQVTKEVFVNKDCKMNYNGTVGPIGTLDRCDLLLDQIGHTPTIQCKKYNCWCGLCAPKAADQDTYNSIMKKYLPL